MTWEQLLIPIRYGLEDYFDQHHHNDSRTEFQRDYDRLIFSSPFRRLQNKTQVFPLPGSVFVHNRLTHSLEVSSVGRSLGTNVGNAMHAKYTKRDIPFDAIGSIVSAACLAHDLGNPPFGHSGEHAIGTFFSDAKTDYKKLYHLTDAQWADCVKFEGNANTFRMLTHQFNGRRKGGFVLTYSTLASIVKYPYSAIDSPKQKFGFFDSDKETWLTIANRLGIPQQGEKMAFARYPLVYLVEAADDICYEIMDIEDAHKLSILSYDETEQLLLNFFEGERKERIYNIMNKVDDKNERIAYLRSCVIGSLIELCSKIFIENEESILNGTFEGSLIKHLPAQELQAYKTCSQLSVERIYRSQDVLDIELAGYKIINILMQELIEAVFNPEKTYSRQLLQRIPQQFEVYSAQPYTRIQAVLDYVSGMTDNYALDLYRKITGMSLPTL